MTAATRPAAELDPDALARVVEEILDDVGSAAGRGVARGVVGGPVVGGVRVIDPADVALLHPDEEPVVAQAVATRRAEFASGRTLLRRLLGSNAPVPVGPTRAPVFAPGIVGSLAHDRDVCVAVVGRASTVAALGIDVEPDEPLDAAMARTILRPDEQAIDAHLAFTLKEAAYKCWSSLGGPILDHHDVRLTVADHRFRACVVDDGFVVDGGWRTAAGRHLAIAIVPDRSAATAPVSVSRPDEVGSGR